MNPVTESAVDLLIDGPAADELAVELQGWLVDAWNRQIDVARELPTAIAHGPRSGPATNGHDGREGAPADANTRSEVVDVCTLVLTLPPAVLAMSELSRRMELQRRLGELIAITERWRASHNTRVRFRHGRGCIEMVGVNPTDIMTFLEQLEQRA